MNTKQRLHKLLKLYLILLTFGFCYYCFTQLTHLSVPCLFHEVTHLSCPGCGITRLILHAVKFEWAKAFACNPGLVIISPLLFYLFILESVTYVRYGTQKLSKANNILLYLCIIYLLLWAIIRNIYQI